MLKTCICSFLLTVQLEAELKAIQIMYKEKIEAQSSQLHTLHESILIITSNVEEMQRMLENSLLLEIQRIDFFAYFFLEKSL